MNSKLCIFSGIVFSAAASTAMAGDAPLADDTSWYSSNSFTHTTTWFNIGSNDIEAFVIEIVSDASGQGFSSPAGQVDSGAWTFDGASSTFALFTGSGDFVNQWSFDGPDTGGVADFDLIYRIHFFDSVGTNNFTYEWNNTSSASGDDLGLGYGGVNLRNIGAQNLDLNTVIAAVPLPPAAWGGLAMLGGLVGVRRLRK